MEKEGHHDHGHPGHHGHHEHPEHPDHASKSEYSQLLSKAMNTSHRFEVETEQFDHNYLHGRAIENHHTKRFTPWIVKSIKQKYEKLKRPLVICDFCCGCGDTTSELLQQIEAQGVQVQQMIGYDISDEFLTMSKKYATDKLTFQKCNLEKDFNEEAKFDVMIVLHGFIWMNDLDRAIESSYLALKPEGLLFSLTLIENRKFYKARLDFMQNPKWCTYFKHGEFELYPFHFSETVYTKIFDRYFDAVHQEKSQIQFQYKQDQLAIMLEGDFQEVRHLEKFEHSDLEKDAVANAYTTHFVKNLENIQGCIKIKNENLIGYSPVMFFYEGSRKKDD